MADPRRRRAWWIGGGIAAVVLIVGGGVGAYAATTSGGSASAYRSVLAANGTVQETLALPGTVARVNQVTAAFPSSGTVTSVAVTVGDTVTAGQSLATMDATTLRAALLAAQATLAQDQASLAADQSGSSTGATSTQPAPAGSRGTSGASSASAALTRGLAQAQTSLTTVQHLLGQVDQLCTPVSGSSGSGSSGSGSSGSGSGPTSSPAPTDSPSPSSPTPSPTLAPTPTPTPTPTASPTPTPTPTPSPSPTGGTGSTPTPAQVAACVSALHTTVQALEGTESAVSHLVQQLAATSKSAASPGGAASSAGQGASSPRTTGSSGGAARVASDEVAVLQDQQAVSTAQTNLDAATLTAPIGGTVAQVDLVTGSAASTGSGIVIVGPGAAVVTVDVPLSHMAALKAGMAAHVVPAGAVDGVDGTVESIDLLPASSTSGSPTYPVKILVAAPTASLASGSNATVQIVVGSTTDALRVPASAMSGRTGDAATVTVLVDGRATPTPVTVGAVGGGWAQILTGLSAGQRVVLADAAQALPTSTTGFAGRLGGGFGGGGFTRQGTGAGGSRAGTGG